jgi:hypothetical protein
VVGDVEAVQRVDAAAAACCPRGRTTCATRRSQTAASSSPPYRSAVCLNKLCGERETQKLNGLNKKKSSLPDACRGDTQWRSFTEGGISTNFLLNMHIYY